MPRYTIRDDTGRSITVEGDSPPSEQEAEELFGSSKQSAAPGQPKKTFAQRFSELGQNIKQATMVSPEQQAQTKKEVKEGGMMGLFGDIPQEFGKQFSQGAQALGDDLSAAVSTDPASVLKTYLPGPMGLPQGTINTLGDLATTALSPLTGAATSVIGRPVEALTGIRREIPGNIAAAAVPIGGEAKAAKVANTLRDIAGGASDAKYAGKVSRLVAEGVEPTIGQARGGQVARAFEAAKSDPLVGGAIRAQERKALESFQRAAFNRALKPIGETADTRLAGREGLAHTGDRLSAGYEALKPGMRLVPDSELVKQDIPELKKTIATMDPVNQKKFQAFWDNRVSPEFSKGAGSLDGQSFKDVESKITREANQYRGSPDPDQRKYASALQELNGVLRDNLERTSDPGIRKKLKDLNTGWAVLARLEDAASRRTVSGGNFTPGDLLAAVKKGNRSVRKRAFARGDALMQQFAEDAQDVLGNKVPDSGTPERIAWNAHGVGMYALSKLTNPIAGRGMNFLRQFGLNAPKTRNYLLGVSERTSPLRRAPVLALQNLTNQPNQQ